MSQIDLFVDLPERQDHRLEFRGIRSPVWTENKATLVAHYLRLFVMITRHGCYIDGFAGPKQPDIPGMWAAELVMESQPKLLREFFLSDIAAEKIQMLKALRARQEPVKGRSIHVLEGDFNSVVDSVLTSGVITPKKATFCLLDQFSTECHWQTVRALAAHKRETNKIELFYFLASGWLDRTLAAFTRNLHQPSLWWGSDDWRTLIGKKSHERAAVLCERFKQELGYRYAFPFPIMDRGDRGRVMFHMIHATDHVEAPKLMARAYKQVTNPSDADKQIEMAFEFPGLKKDFSAE